MIFVRLVLVLLCWVVPVTGFAQSFLPSFPTTTRHKRLSEWITAWRAKQDRLNYTAAHQGGDTLTGRLRLVPRNTILAPINLGVGFAPTFPQNGDIWETTSGLFVYTNNFVQGPFIASFTFSGDVTNNLSIVNLNTVNTVGSTPQTYGGNGLVPVIGFNNKGLVTSVNQNVTDATGFRNRIINPEMTIAQLGTSVSSGLNTYTYTLDRWVAYATGAAVNISQVSAASGQPYANALRITGAASNSYVSISQRIESFNTSDLAGGAVAFQAMLVANTSYTLTWKLLSPTTPDNYGGINTIATGTWGATNVPTIQTATAFGLPASAANGLQLVIGVNNFTGGTIDITGVQLEPGQNTTLLERRPLYIEFPLAQRYLYCISTWNIGITTTNATWSSAPTIPFPGSMRVHPNLITAGASFIANIGNNGTPTSGSSNYNSATVINSANNWSGNGVANVTFTGCFNAEIY